MNHLNSIKKTRTQISDWKKQSQRIGFVPTMGNLHDGHLSLMQHAQQHADKVIVSIFVNPLQFGPHEDFDLYPRTLDTDCKKLKQLGVDAIFLPTRDALYPNDETHHASITLPSLSDLLDGHSRPGFFQGVATVVTKLFNIVTPDLAVFGDKDYQQLLIIKQLVKDLCFPIDILGAPIVREQDGLAMSSRNQYLSENDRAHAPLLYQTLKQVDAALKQGNTDFAALQKEATHTLNTQGFNTDYFEICHAETLQPATPGDPLRLLAAAWRGTTRLIDNLSARPR